MTKINIDSKEYEYENLSDTSKLQLSRIKYVQKEINKLRADLDILKTAESVYYAALIKEVNSKEEN